MFHSAREGCRTLYRSWDVNCDTVRLLVLNTSAVAHVYLFLTLGSIVLAAFSLTLATVGSQLLRTERMSGEADRTSTLIDGD